MTFHDLRCAQRTERPTIVVFDRGLLDCKAYMPSEKWLEAVSELDRELRGPQRPLGSMTEEHLRAR